MAVQYIIGRAGRGKTRKVFEQIKTSLNNTEDEKLILIVPEQFTLQAERDLIEYLGTPGIMKIEVLSFTRLAYHVFNEVGGITRTPIDDQGKSMVLRKTIHEIQSQLSVYHKAAQQDGFISKFIELVSAFKKNNVDPSYLKSQWMDMEQGMMKEKLQDISTIYEKLLENYGDSYMDSDDAMGLLLEKMQDSTFLKNSHIWIDGFSSFPLQSITMIQRLMAISKNTCIALPMDREERPRDGEVFQLTKRILDILQEGAQEAGIEQEMIDLNGQENKWIQEEIRHLEGELYAYPFRTYDKKVENIEIFKASNIYNETEFMAAKVIELVRDRGYRWREIAIVCNDLEGYSNIIKRTLEEYHIPYFLDQKRNIMNNPIIEYILSCIEVITKGYRYQDVSRLFKTGFSGLTIDEYEKLELYMIRYGIKGKKWKSAFAWGKEEDLEELNQSREKLIGSLSKMEEKLKGKHTCAETTRILYAYLEEMQLKEKLEEWIQELRQEGLYEYVNENTQIWNIVMNTFDQLVEILGSESISFREYHSILQAGFSSYEIGIIPTSLDQVLVGQIQRSKSHDIKALFVVGVNDGILPSGLSEEDILSNDEKIKLQEVGIDVGTDFATRSTQERYLIYSSMSKPREYLCLSYALADGEGKAMRPSSLIDRMQKIFPKLLEESDLIDKDVLQERLISIPHSTFKHLIANLRQEVDGHPTNDLWWQVYGWYFQQDQWRETRERMIEGLFHNNQVKEVGKEQAKSIYKYPIRSSVSRLEGYVNCPFAHFIKYGLKPKQVKEYKVEAPDIGTLFHDSIAVFTNHLRKRGVQWAEIDKDLAHQVMEQVVEEMVPQYGEGVFYSTHRYKYLVERLKRISKRAIWTLTTHLKQGDFVLLDHEIAFGREGTFPAIEIELSDGSKIFLEGRIDRVDILQGTEEDYVKVIDYKSGNQDFSLSDVYYGLSLQLMVYIAASLQKNPQNEKPLKPAGVFYFKIDDPMVKSDEEIAEKVEQEIEKELKMKGLVLKDVDIVRAMDRDMEKHSKIIPVGLKKGDEFYKNSSIIGQEGFYQLLHHAQGLIKDISEEMLRGNIKIHPVKQGTKTACDYCPYSGICQFDTLFADNQYRYIKKLKDQEVLEKIQSKGEVTKHGEVDRPTTASD